MSARDFWATIRAMIQEEMKRGSNGLSLHGEDFIVIPNSWNPAEGTVDVVHHESLGNIGSDSEGILVLQNVRVLAPIHGQQGGPVGGERIILFRRHGGYLGLLEHGPDDSPGAPAGEHWITIPSGATIKAQANGNVSVNAPGTSAITAQTISHTATGNATITATSQVELTGATAIVNGSSSAAINAPSISFGPTGSSGYAVVRTVDLTTLITWLTNHVHGNGNNGNNTTAPTTTPPTPSGSSIASCA